MDKKLVIRAGDLEDGAARFIRAWHAAERGEEVADFSLTFETMDDLLGVLTRRRWQLLRTLRRYGALSVNALAKHLQRDYKNVHTDVGALEELGLISRTQHNKIEVPWDEIEAHMKLAA